MSLKRSAADAELGAGSDDDEELDERLAARVARYASTVGGQRAAAASASASRQSSPARILPVGRRSKNARPAAAADDADLDLSFYDTVAAPPPEDPRACDHGNGFVDLTEEDESPVAAVAAAAAAAPAAAAAASSHSQAVELLSSDSEDDGGIVRGSEAVADRGVRRLPGWMAVPQDGGGASGRGGGARASPRQRPRRISSGGRAGRVRVGGGGGASGGTSGSGGGGGPDLDADARLARQLQQQEDEEARQHYRQRHQQQWQGQRQDLRRELEDLDDEEEHYHNQGLAAGMAARIANQIGMGSVYRQVMGQGHHPGAGWGGPHHGGGGHGGDRRRGGGGRGRGGQHADLEGRELTEDDYARLSELDSPGSRAVSGASKAEIDALSFKVRSQITYSRVDLLL